MPFENPLAEKEKPTAVEVRSALLGAGEYLHGLLAKKPDERGDGFADDVRSAKEFIVGDGKTTPGYDAVLTALEAAESRGANFEAGDGPRGSTAPGARAEMRTAGQMVIGSEEYATKAKDGITGATFAQVDLRGSMLYAGEGAEFRANDTITSATSGAGAAGVFRPVGTPADFPPPVRQRRLFVRDLLNVQPTGLASVPYIRESMPSTDESANTVGGTNDSGARMTAEGAAKQQVDMAWSQDDAPARKVTAWIPLTTEIIEDAPTLMGYVDGRLVYLLALREEIQILDGTGTAPQLKGILRFSGLQSQDPVAYPGQTIDTDDVSLAHIDAMATLGMAISLVENVDGEADGIVIHPLDYWPIVTTRRAAQFEGQGGIPSGPFSTPPGDLWGLPTVRSRSTKLHEPVVGSWGLGATLFDRQRTTIKVGNQHSDYFTTNKVAVVAEERVALAVHRPDFFVKAKLYGPPA